LPGSDDRRRRPHPSGARRAPPLTGSWSAPEGEPVAGAPGWRVTRRVASPSEGAAGAPQRPGVTIQAETVRSGPQAMPGQFGVLARSPRRVGAPDQGRRGISFLALAAAAVVVMFVLGLAALDTERLHWPLAWAERPALNPDGHPAGAGPTGEAAGGALTERPG
jgi:hypothetical protein